MSKTITIPGLYGRGGEEWSQIVIWLVENVGQVKTYERRLKAYGWEMWHTDSRTKPTYKQTKIRFNNPEHATLFAMRWAE
jgi:hypothetical protein